ncbi:MAG: NADH-quinone oxidoreductase subunit NuoH [Thermoplasmata archaeon]|nr:NADH-quinone oxidoreductase subunit NuoH [Thermoplasmata archaeon]
MNLWDVSYAISKFLMDIVNFIFSGILGLIPDPVGSFFEGIGSWSVSAGVVNFITMLLEALIIIIVALLNVIILIWIERKILARIMDSRGPFYVGPIGFFQNIADGAKLFVKQIIIPRKVDKFGYQIAPLIFVGSSFLILSVIPLSPGFAVTDSNGLTIPGGILFAFAVFAIAPFSILVAGWSENNKYTLIGGMRSAAQMMSYEIPMLLTVASVFLLVGSFEFSDVVSAQQNIWFGIPLFLGLIVFIACMIAEVERIPFDLPEAEAELVEGWTTEYCGMRFGFFMFTEYMRGYAGCGIATLLFLGGWLGPDFIPDEIWFLIKAYIVFLVFIFIRGALPRIRTDQILDLGWKRLLPLAVLNLLIAVAIKAAGWI